MGTNGSSGSSRLNPYINPRFSGGEEINSTRCQPGDTGYLGESSRLVWDQRLRALDQLEALARKNQECVIKNQECLQELMSIQR